METKKRKASKSDRGRQRKEERKYEMMNVKEKKMERKEKQGFCLSPFTLNAS
jgi:hypothetical protein